METILKNIDLFVPVSSINLFSNIIDDFWDVSCIFLSLTIFRKKCLNLVISKVGVDNLIWTHYFSVCVCG